MKLSLHLSPWKKNAAIIAAAVTVVAGVVAGRERPSMEIIQEKAKPAADDGIDLGKPRRGEATQPQTAPFARSFGQPQQPASTNAAGDETPAAPPQPVQYYGRLTENGKTEVYVMRGDELITLAPGQKIGDYRVEQIADASISFTYLPLKMKQTLDLK